MQLFNKYSLLLITATSLWSCDNPINKDDNEPGIIIGDSTTIVIEEDSQYLQNIVIDLKEREIIELPEQTVAVVPEQRENAVVEEQNTEEITEVVESTFGPRKESGFTIDFGTIQVVISGIEETKEFLQQDPTKMDGVSYLITKGDLKDATMTVRGARNYAVRQRYRTNLFLVGKNNEEIEIKKAGRHASEWVALDNKAPSNSYFQAALYYPETFAFSKITPNNLRNAVQTEVKNRRFNRTTANQWIQLSKQSNHPQKEPFKINVHSFQWQISATDASGQQIFKTISLEL